MTAVSLSWEWHEQRSLIYSFNRQIIYQKFLPTIHNLKWVKLIQIWQNGGQWFWNLADWCRVLSLPCTKAGLYCANKNWKNPKIIGLAHKERFLYTISPWASTVSGYIMLPVTLERVSSFQKENIIWFYFPWSHTSTPIVYVNLTMQSWPVLLCCVVYIWNLEYH